MILNTCVYQLHREQIALQQMLKESTYILREVATRGLTTHGHLGSTQFCKGGDTSL